MKQAVVYKLLGMCGSVVKLNASLTVCTNVLIELQTNIMLRVCLKVVSEVVSRRNAC